jgi:hypothetical protein
VKSGLADAITTTFNMEDSPPLEKIMETEKKITEEPVDFKAESDTFRADLAEISRLCKLAKMPEKLAEFVESGASVDEARDALMRALACKTEDIRSTVQMCQTHAESLVVAAAKARAANI